MNARSFPTRSVVTVLVISMLVAGCAGKSTMKPNGYFLAEAKYYECLKAADHGDAASYYRLQQHYTLGLGLYAIGEMWLKGAAERGHPAGMYEYGVALWNTAANEKERQAATNWIRRAARAGDVDARKFLQEKAKQ